MIAQDAYFLLSSSPYLTKEHTLGLNTASGPSHDQGPCTPTALPTRGFALTHLNCSVLSTFRRYAQQPFICTLRSEATTEQVDIEFVIEGYHSIPTRPTSMATTKEVSVATDRHSHAGLQSQQATPSAACPSSSTAATIPSTYSSTATVRSVSA